MSFRNAHGRRLYYRGLMTGIVLAILAGWAGFLAAAWLLGG